MTNTIIPLMHPCLILCAWRVCEEAVVRGGDEGGDWVSKHAISGVQTRKSC